MMFVRLLFASFTWLAATPSIAKDLPADDGYRGIWYFNTALSSEYRYKYSGGMATYPQQHAPIAIYAPSVEKTFFVYGGTIARGANDDQELLHMVSYYDHKTGMVPRPRVLMNKHTDDAHDNPTLSIDDDGYLWVFSTSHGAGRPSYIHRSTKPWSIDQFEEIQKTNFSYTQPWHVPGKGFLFLHTLYDGGKSQGIPAQRPLFFKRSANGRDWSEPEMLAGIEQGDYQISWQHKDRVATAFDHHPQKGGLDARSNIYYLETRDLGRLWTTIGGATATLPITETPNPALIYDAAAEKKLVYLKDLNFDAEGHPVILYLTSRGPNPGPEDGPHEWKTVRWTGSEWVRKDFTTSDNNYDHGSLSVESDGTWRIIAPTQTGPQPYNPGGEMVMWTSADQGSTWTEVKQLTTGSLLNHSYARRPLNAHPDFYAIWADGHGRQPSESNLYFTSRTGDHVWRLPPVMTTEFAKPVIAW